MNLTESENPVIKELHRMEAARQVAEKEADKQRLALSILSLVLTIFMRR